MYKTNATLGIYPEVKENYQEPTQIQEPYVNSNVTPINDLMDESSNTQFNDYSQNSAIRNNSNLSAREQARLMATQRSQDISQSQQPNPITYPTAHPVQQSENIIPYHQQPKMEDDISQYIALSYKIADYLKNTNKDAYYQCSRFYETNSTIYIIIIFILVIICLILIKKVLNV